MALKYPTTSKTLLDRIASGDEISWDEFYRRYKKIVLGVAKFKGLQEQDANDVLQAVMLEFFKQSKTFKFDPDIARFRTYFGRIVHAKIVDHYRAKERRQKLTENVTAAVGEETAASAKESGEDLVFMTEWRKSILRDAFEKLRERVEPDTWQAYEMYAIQNRPVEKVAAYLDYTVNQVYQAKKRCTAMLREIITALNEQDPELKLELLHHEL